MTPALELKNISKTFGTFKANDKINLTLRSGEVHALLGENGAGKSTLVKTIYGQHPPDPGGEIFIGGQKIRIKSSAHAIKLGIGMVHQHFRLVRPFSILQNIILGAEPHFFGRIDYPKARQKINEIISTYHLEMNLDQKIEDASVGVQQRVEIVKILYRNADILLLDEPTAVLTPQEIEDFYLMVANLKALGKTILIITHKLQEIKKIADRCTVIRKGRLIETLEVEKASEQELAAKMVGREVELKVAKARARPGTETLFVIENLTVLNAKNLPALKNFNLKLRRGEITGLAGIDGNGQSELAMALTGLCPIQSGSITLKGKELARLSPKKIYESKVNSIPGDRQRMGLVMEFKIKENLLLQKISDPPYSRYGFIISRELSRFSRELIAQFDIRPPDPEAITSTLSGGNQQKIILAREIANDPEVLIAFQPTRGLDVGAIEYIHRELIKLRDEQKAILLISYELDEIINLSDRIAILYQGTLSADLEGDDLHNNPRLKEDIGLFMAGGQPR